MKKLIAALAVTFCAAGSAFAQGPPPPQPGRTLENIFAVPAQKSEMKQDEKKSIKKAKKTKKNKQIKKAGKKAPGKKTTKKIISSAR